MGNERFKHKSRSERERAIVQDLAWQEQQGMTVVSAFLVIVKKCQESYKVVQQDLRRLHRGKRQKHHANSAKLSREEQSDRIVEKEIHLKGPLAEDKEVQQKEQTNKIERLSNAGAHESCVVF